MRQPRWGVTVAGLAGALACGFPTDRGADLRVELDLGEQQLVIGERLSLRPRLVDEAGTEVVGARFGFRSADAGIVQISSDGIALATGVGRASVVVTALTFETAAPDSVTFRVIGNISIDKVSPSAARFGEVVTVVGTGLDPASAALIAVGGLPAPVAGFVPADFGNPASRDTLRVFVPAGAAPDGDLVVLRASGGSANSALTVEQVDLYEPNDDAPVRISGPPFFNPQLAFEAGVVPPFDWYRLGSLTGDFTVTLLLGLSNQTGVGQATVRSPTPDGSTPPSWSVAARVDEAMCHGLLARFVERFEVVNTDVADVPIHFPFRGTALDSLDLTVEMFGALFEARPYLVVVQPGYVSVFPPDAHEENDFCDAAPLVENGFATTLSIDNHHDVDWFRFTLAATSDVVVDVNCVTCGDPDFAGDIDLIVFEDVLTGRPETPDELPVAAFAENFDTVAERLEATLPTGDYFLVVQNAFYDPVAELNVTVSLTPNAGAALSDTSTLRPARRASDRSRRVARPDRRGTDPVRPRP